MPHSPHNLIITSDQFLDRVFGNSVMLISGLSRFDTGQLCRGKEKEIPESVQLLFYWPLPLNTNRLFITQFMSSVEANVARWSHAVAHVKLSQDPTQLVDLVSAQTLPIVSVTVAPEIRVEVLFRVDAESKNDWQEKCDKLWIEMHDRKIEVDPPDWQATSFLPNSKQHPHIRLFYLNLDLGIQ